MHDQSRKTLRKAFDDELRQSRLQVRTLIPAKVLRYDRNTQTALIELATQRVSRDGTKTKVDPPLTLDNVPVVWPAGSFGYVHADLEPEDPGLAMVCDRSIAKWRQTGQASAPPLPFSHNLADAVFLPGLTPDIQTLNPPPAAKALTVEGQEIRLGAAASLPAARQTDTVEIASALLDFCKQASLAIVELQTTLAALTLKTPAAPAPGPITPKTTIGLISAGSQKTKIE